MGRSLSEQIITILFLCFLTAPTGASELDKNTIEINFPPTIDRLLIIEEELPFDDDSISKPDTLLIDSTNELYKKIINGIESVDCCYLRMKKNCGQDYVKLLIKIEINPSNSFIIQCEREICPKGIIKGAKIKPIVAYFGDVDGEINANENLIKDLTNLYWKIKSK
jgi:hypothetical protein